jgi:SPP1 family predicted phage head-tail adaptor
MRHRIEIYSPSSVQDSFGGVAPDAGTLFATTWAKVVTPQGRELFTAQQQVSQVTHKITMRWAQGVVAKQFVLFDGRYFSIEAVSDPDGQHVYLELLCIERNDSANFTGGAAQ